MPVAIFAGILALLAFLHFNYLGCWNKLCDYAARQELMLTKEERDKLLPVEIEERKALFPITIKEREAAIARRESSPPASAPAEVRSPTVPTRETKSPDESWEFAYDGFKLDETGRSRERRHPPMRESGPRDTVRLYSGRPAYSGYGPASAPCRHRREC